MRVFRSNRGFSLIMSLLAISILGAVSLAVIALFNSVNAQSKNMNSGAGVRALISTLQGFISYPSLCIANLDPSTRKFDETQAATNVGISLTIQLGAGASGPKVEAGSKLLTYDVVVEYLRYRNAALIGGDPAIAGNQLYSGEMMLKVQKYGGGNIAGGADLRERGVGTLVLSVNPTSKIIGGCYALVDARQACIEVGGTYDSFTTPKCKLPYPCAGIPNSMFLGYDAAGVAQCKTMSQIVGTLCPAGQYLVSDGAGGTSCKGP